MYGVFGNSPTSVKLVPVTVAIRTPERSTSKRAVDEPAQPIVMVLDDVAVTLSSDGVPAAGGGTVPEVLPVGGGWTEPEPTVAVSTGVVDPLARTEYRYGVLGSRPMSVKLVPFTVAIRSPERSTS